MNIILKGLIAVSAVALLAGCMGPKRPPPGAAAGPGPDSPRILRAGGLLFASFDADQDYVVSPSEFDVGIAKSFEHADTNRSGRLDLHEFQSWSGKVLDSNGAAPDWITLDVDENGGVDREEFYAEFHRLALTYGLSQGDGLALYRLTAGLSEMTLRRPGGRGGGPGGGRGGPPQN